MRVVLGVLFAGAGIAVAAAAGGPVSALVERLKTDAVRFNAWLPDTEPTAAAVARGHTVAMGGASRNGAQFACFTCHGGNGGGDSAGAIPRLAGLPAAYLAAQLAQYASGERVDPMMTPIAQALSVDEIKAAAIYYAAMAPASAMAEDGAANPDEGLAQHGARLSLVGSAESAIPACSNCHGPYGTGMAPSVPPLAGQAASYASKRLQHWRTLDPAEHPENPMVPIAGKMSDRDIEAVSIYFEALDLNVGTSPARTGPGRDG